MNRINANIAYVASTFLRKNPTWNHLTKSELHSIYSSETFIKGSIVLPRLSRHWVLVCSATGIQNVKQTLVLPADGCSLKGGEYISPQWKETKRNLCVWSGFTFPYILHSCALGFSFSSSRGLCFFTKSVSSWISLLAVSYIFGSVPAAADSFYNQNAITAPMYLNITHVIFCWKDN